MSSDLPSALLVPPPSPTKDRWLLAALTLVALSILIPELLTGSTPVASLVLNPLSLPFLLGLYGCGVLLVREITVRWEKGWPSVLLLGGAYGILEEGPGTKTFFDPRVTSAAGSLAPVGHAFGVNWVWVLFISVFHAVFSIGLPILLVGLAYPETRGRRLVTDRTLVCLGVAYAVTVLAMYFLFDPAYRPSAGVLAFFLGVVGALVLLAARAPARWPFARPDRPLLPPFWVGILGGLWVFLWFGFFWLGASLHEDPYLIVFSGVTFTAAIGFVLVPEVEVDEPHRRLCLATGLLSFVLVFSAVVTLGGDFLAPLATIAMIWFLVRLRSQRRAGERPGPSLAPPLAIAPPAPPPGAL
jgi:hypothetical protein